MMSTDYMHAREIYNLTEITTALVLTIANVSRIMVLKTNLSENTGKGTKQHSRVHTGFALNLEGGDARYVNRCAVR